MSNEFENNYSETTENFEAPALEGYGESQTQNENKTVVYQKDNSLAKAALIVGGVVAVGTAAVKLGGKALTWISEKHLKKKGYILSKPVTEEEPVEEPETEVAEKVEAEVVSETALNEEPKEPVKKRK